LKIEWATQKDGKLIVGSTGKERTGTSPNPLPHAEGLSREEEIKANLGQARSRGEEEITRARLASQTI